MIQIKCSSKLSHPASQEGLKTVFSVLVFVEILALFGILNEWPILGDYYESQISLSTILSVVVALFSLLLWFRIAKSAIPVFPIRLGNHIFHIPYTLVWVVMVANYAATAFIGYGTVGYTSKPFAFLLTVLPLDPLLIAYFCQRRKFDWWLAGAYALLGILRGWTGHLFVLFITYLLFAPQRRRKIAILSVIIGTIFIYEPLMQVRALIRGFDDSTGVFVYRIVSRLAMTPITDYELNNLPAIAVCDGMSYMGWAEELAFSVIPRSFFGIEQAKTIHSCLAVMASGDPNTEISFSTTLAVKAALVWVKDPLEFALFIVIVFTLIRIMVFLAKRVLGSDGYVYVTIFMSAFFISGVMRDLAIPVYFLFLIFIIGYFMRAGSMSKYKVKTFPAKADESPSLKLDRMDFRA